MSSPSGITVKTLTFRGFMCAVGIEQHRSIKCSSCIIIMFNGVQTAGPTLKDFTKGRKLQNLPHSQCADQCFSALCSLFSKADDADEAVQLEGRARNSRYQHCVAAVYVILYKFSKELEINLFDGLNLAQEPIDC